MKNLLFTMIALMVTNVITAQMQTIDIFRASYTDLFRKDGSRSKYNNAIGSPYLFEKFYKAQIKNVPELIMVRYNAETDAMEVEVNEDDQPMVLPKNETYQEVVIQMNNMRFLLLNYKDAKGNEMFGYLIETKSVNNVVLFKKEKVLFIPEKQPATSYDTYSPPKLEKISPEFFLQYNGAIVSFPKNKKLLLELIPGKKGEIETYLKENKISFKSEEDLAKLTEFIGNL